jgi:hypothetical protein
MPVLLYRGSTSSAKFFDIAYALGIPANCVFKRRAQPTAEAVKQEFARTVHRHDRCAGQSGVDPEDVWQRRFYDPSAPLRISAAGSDAR